MGRGETETGAPRGLRSRLRRRPAEPAPSPLVSLTDSLLSLNELIDPPLLPGGECDLEAAARVLSIQYGGRRHYPADGCERCREIERTYEGLADKDARTWVILLRNQLALFHHAPREGEALCQCERCTSIRWALGWAAKALATAR